MIGFILAVHFCWAFVVGLYCIARFYKRLVIRLIDRVRA